MKPGWTYILHTDDGKLVKVGYTILLEPRLRQHMRKSIRFGPVHVIGVTRSDECGDYDLRRKLKRITTRPANINGRKQVIDWFFRNPQVDQAIDKLKLREFRFSSPL